MKTQQWLKHYHDDGFVGPIDVLSQEQAYQHRQRLQTAESAFGDRSLSRQGSYHFNLSL